MLTSRGAQYHGQLRQLCPQTSKTCRPRACIPCVKPDMCSCATRALAGHSTTRARHRQRALSLCLAADTEAPSAISSINDSSAEPQKKEKKQRLSDEEIAARITESRQRKAALQAQGHACPSCSKPLLSPRNIFKHVSRCCPDLMGEESELWEQVLNKDVPKHTPVDHEAIAGLLKKASAREESARQTALHWTFRSGLHDAEGNLIRLDSREVGRRMNLPSLRAAALVRAAMRTVPLVGDDITGAFQHEGGPAPLVVVHEDDDFVAVAKPPGVLTCPTHRFKGGSMVNQMITYLNGATPRVLHRLDVDTSGLLLFAKHPAVASGVHKQFRDRTVSKLYLCICMGCPEQAQFDVDAPIAHHPFVGTARAIGPGKEASTSFAVVASNPHAELHPDQDSETSLGALFDLEAYRQGVSSLDVESQRRLHPRSEYMMSRAASMGDSASEGSGSSSSSEIDGMSSSSSSSSASGWASSDADSEDDASIVSESEGASVSSSQGWGVESQWGASRSEDLGESVEGSGEGISGASRSSYSSSGEGAGPSDLSNSSLGQASLGCREASSSDSSSSSSSSSRDSQASTSGPLLGVSLVACAPHSGRTHQIRLHMAHAGHPLLGDELYGVKVPWIKRQALHAAGMGLEHPISHQHVRFLAPLPQDFMSALESLGLVGQGGAVEGVDRVTGGAARVVRPEDLQAAVEDAWNRLKDTA